MQLTLKDIQNAEPWKTADIKLPAYNASATAANGREHSVWMHFGIGNIFRIFIGSIADRLITDGFMDAGLTCVETYDYEVVDRIYRPHDNLMLSVILNNDGTREEQVLAPFVEAIKADCTDDTEWSRLKSEFCAPYFQFVSFTITEKGYSLTGADGSYTRLVQSDIDNGPDHSHGAGRAGA
jgi:fructuronate reductase